VATSRFSCASIMMVRKRASLETVGEPVSAALYLLRWALPSATVRVSAALFFDDAEGTEGFRFLLLGQREGVKGFEDVHSAELLEFRFEGVPGYLSVVCGLLLRRTFG
jgi:hypothetical protein